MTHSTRRLLTRHRRSLRARAFAEVSLRIIGTLPWAFVIAVPVAALSSLMMKIWVGTYTAAALYRLIADACRVPPLRPLAHRLEARNPHLQGLLSPSLELEEERSPIEESSPELRAELLRRAAETTQRWKPPAPPLPLWPHARIALTGIVALGLLAAAFPGAFLAAPSALRLSIPEGPRLLKLSATPPRILEGETTRIRVIALGPAIPDTVELGVRVGEANETTRWRPLPRAEQNLFTTSLPHPRRNLLLTARAPGFSADTLRVSVRERPRVERITVTSSPPEHTGLPSASSDGDLVVPSGSAIAVEGGSNVQLASASIALGATDSIVCHIDGADFIAAWTASRDTTWRVILSDAHGTPPSRPRLHRIRVLPDHPPVVELSVPPSDVDLDERMSVALAWRASDDYGLSALELRYEIEEGRGGELDLRQGELGRETEGGTAWSLDPLDLLPGDSIEFWIRARDNDAVGGPKWGESARRRARFPTIVEIYAEVAGHGEEGTRAARELSDAFEEMGERLREIREAAADAGGHLSWDAERELESMQGRGEELRGTVESMEEHLEEEARARAGEMAEAVARKLDEVHRLMDEVLDENLRELMRELGRAIAAADPDELDTSLERAQLLDEEILRNLERTAAILERLRQEKALEEAIAMAAELAEREARIAEMVEEGEIESAASAQERAPGDMEALEEGIAEAARSGIDQDLAAELEEAAEAGLGPVPRARAGRISRDLRNGRIDRASNDLSELRGGLESLHSRLLRLQEMHIERMKGDLEERMRSLFARLAEVSRRAERYGLQASAEPEAAAVLQSRLARNLRSTLDEVETLERESLFVTPDLRGRLSLAADALESSSRELARGRPKPGGDGARRAMTQLNKAGAKLLDGMQALRNAASSTGYPQAMQQLAAAARAQAQLLGQGEQTLPIPGGPAPGPGARASMARMASEQARIRELVAQARRALGDEGGGVGDLRALEEGMKEVEDALRSGAPSESILRQERTILNRLLDAERSVRKQGSSKRRESRVAEAYRWSPDPSTATTPREPTSRSVDPAAIIRALDERYPASYAPLVRAYFRALAERGGRP